MTTFQAVIMYACLAALGLAVLAGIAWLVCCALRTLFRSVPAGSRAALALIAAVCIAYGGTKRLQFVQTNPDYKLIWDDGSELIENELIIRYGRHAILPDDADFQVWARPGGSTNAAEYAALVVSTVGECPSPYTVDLTGRGDNLDIIVFTTWTPAPSVHTNGTLVVKWAGTNKVDDAVFAVPRGTSVHENGAQIAPPERSR